MWTSESIVTRSLDGEYGKQGKTSADGKTGGKAARVAQVLVHLGKINALAKDWRSQFGSGPQLAVRSLEHEGGPRILVSPLLLADPERDPRLKATVATRLRDAVGMAVGELEKLDVQVADVDFRLPSKMLESALLGLEMALYRYKRELTGEAAKFRLRLSHNGRPLTPGDRIGSALALGQAVNLARHLVNLPPNLLNPVSYADFIDELFAGRKGVSVEVWDEDRLKRENMNLHLSVGGASVTPPSLVHIRYRGDEDGVSGAGRAKVSGAKGRSEKAPIALVGKGITFDSGGLDIKPSSGMRLMKKDMGGSAALVGLAWWLAATGAKGNVDIYLALAENAVGGRAFRPGDVVASRSGLSVEIHNTDAEGRLVLADAMDVAVSANIKPRCLIDVATLTGAIKVALGANLAGLFATDVRLETDLIKAAREAGDPVWPMPLVQKYRGTFSSPFADMVNATDGFGGAITAALFLEKFAKGVPWAHLDIYAWKDASEGPWRESGGSGQGVLLLVEWLKRNRAS